MSIFFVIMLLEDNPRIGEICLRITFDGLTLPVIDSARGARRACVDRFWP